MHLKQWHYSLHRDFQNCYSTRRSPTGFFSSNSTRVPIHHTPSIHIHVYTTLHPENSPSRIQFYMQKTKSSSSTTTTSRGQRDLHSRIQKRNSTHRRQGDLLEMHPCVLQDLPRHSRHSSLSRHSRHSSLSSLSRHSRHSSPPVSPDIPVVPDTPETFRTFQSFMTFQPLQAILQSSSISRESTPLQHSPVRMHILQFDWVPQKLHRVPVEQYKLQTFYKHYILQRKGDVVISVKFVSVKMSR